MSQTYRNFEIIILDDCSNDNGLSKSIIEEYRNNPFVSTICYNDTNSGNTFLQWQKGIQLAKGNLIWIAESDDCCYSSFLEELIKQFEMFPDCVLSYTTSEIINDKGIKLFTPKTTCSYHFTSNQYLTRYLLFSNMVLNASSAVFKKNVINNFQNDFTKYKGAGDYLFWIEVAKQGSISVNNHHLNQFRRHSSVITNKMDSNGSNLFDEFEIFQILRCNLKITYPRLRLAYSVRAKRIHHTLFSSRDIQDKIETLWQTHNYEKIFDVIGRKLLSILWNRFNFYL